MSQALERFKRWIAENFPSHTAAAIHLGCTQSMLSRLLSQEHRITIDLAATVERETADWAEGPIRASEWAEPRKPRAVSAPRPRQQYRPVYSRKHGVRRA